MERDLSRSIRGFSSSGIQILSKNINIAKSPGRRRAHNTKGSGSNPECHRIDVFVYEKLPASSN